MSVVTVPESISTLDQLSNSVTELKEKKEKTFASLKTAKEWHITQAQEISRLLKDLGQDVVTEVLEDKPKENKPKRVRAVSNKMTAADAVEKLLLLEQYKEGLSRSAIVVKVISEIGYQTSPNATADAVASSIYSGGINKLVKSRKVVAVAGNPVTLYKHVNFSVVAATDSSSDAK